MLQCPSDPADPLFDSLLPDGTVAKVAGLNYMYSYGSGTGTNYDDRYPTDGFVVTNGYLTPNSRIPDINVHGRGWFGPRSMHSGGAQVTLGDGSTHLLSDGIVAVWMETLYRHRHSMAPNFWSVHAYPSLRMRIVVASRTAVLIWPRWSRASLSFYGVRRKSLAIMPAQSSAAIALTTLAKREFSIAWMSTADKPTTPSDLGRSVGVPRS